MRDAFLVKGQTLSYSDKEWTVGELYTVPGNPELYIQLINNGSTMNTRLSEINHLITKTKKGEKDLTFPI